jgi:hypothetical protein
MSVVYKARIEIITEILYMYTSTAICVNGLDFYVVREQNSTEI